MKNILIAFVLFFSLSMKAQLPGDDPKLWSEGIAQTVMTRYPSALMIPFKPWCYPQGYFLIGLDKLWQATGKRKYYDYIMNWANEVVRPDGSLVYFRGRSMDDMMAGSVIVWAYRQTGDEKFKKAADYIRKSYDDYSRTSDGVFWHGRGTVGQIWVDGVFMGQMFLTKYGRYIGDSKYCFDEAAKQLIGMHRHLKKGNTGLLYHGWDEDKDARWADPQTGMAPEVWSEGLGWYALILVETLELFPKNHPQYGELLSITRELMAGLKQTQDSENGLWYQVVDKGGEPGNWHETSGSGMFVYAIQRAVELGVIPAKDYAGCVQRGYRGLLSKARVSSDDGLIDLWDANNGLGIQKDYKTYVTRPRKKNGQEVISSFLWATGIVEKGMKEAPYVKPDPCKNFVCTDYSQGKVFIFEDGKKVWEHDAPLSNDIWVLDNGNLLFTTGHGVLEVNRAKDTVFHYTSPSHIFACQRLANGNTFIGECNSGRLLEVTSDGKVVKELCILPTGVTDGKKSFIRNARRLDNGHYLVAHYGGKKVVEYDENGTICWEVPVSGGAHSVIRLPNGNTLVAVADADKNPRIVEFNPEKQIVWELSNKDIPGAPLRFMSGMQYIPEIGLILTNWTGHGDRESLPHMLWVDRNKNIVDVFAPCEGIETFSSVFIPLAGENIYH